LENQQQNSQAPKSIRFVLRNALDLTHLPPSKALRRSALPFAHATPPFPAPILGALTFGARKPNLKLGPAISVSSAGVAFFFGETSIMLSKFFRLGDESNSL
jgi:hypothetical protein